MPLFVYTIFPEHAICAREGLQIERVSDSFILLQKCYMNDFCTCLGGEITSDFAKRTYICGIKTHKFPFKQYTS